MLALFLAAIVLVVIVSVELGRRAVSGRRLEHGMDAMIPEWPPQRPRKSVTSAAPRGDLRWQSQKSRDSHGRRAA